METLLIIPITGLDDFNKIFTPGLFNDPEKNALDNASEGMDEV